MKHNWKITAILLAMFLITQIIGLFVINAYTPIKQELIINGTITNITLNPLPYGLEPPEIEKDISLISIIISFIIAITLIMILSKYKWKTLIRIWFLVVIIISLGIAFNALFLYFGLSTKIESINNITTSSLIALLIAIPLAIYKVYKPNFLIHHPIFCPKSG